MSNILFLQGPLGPFFGVLAKKLSALGNTTFKINFNGGDTFFSSADYVFNYRGRVKSWSRYLSMFIKRNKIDAIVVYGDCRHYHSLAKDLCIKQGVEFWVFEEGYLRPDFITFEKGGVNANTNVNFLEQTNNHVTAKRPVHDVAGNERSIGSTFLQRLYYSTAYYSSVFLTKKWLINDGHHRQYKVWEEALFWGRFTVKKSYFSFSQKRLEKRIVQELSDKYFFVPLQVHCDSQILAHSDFDDIRDFIKEVMVSFAENAPLSVSLIFKHHPMDLGFRDYGKLIRRYAGLLGIGDRVIYGHELHLPTMLKNSLGTVTINSTVGISSLINGRPTKVLGRANYDIPGITSSLPLDEFWQRPCPVNRQFFLAYRQVLKQQTQINGSFYKDIDWTCDQILSWLHEKNVQIEDRGVLTALAEPNIV